MARIRDLIAAGITYQVNLTSQWVGGAADPTRLYARMLAAQRCRYGALLMDATLGVVSASPELFFEVIGDRIVTRPMKGTSRRGRWPAEDERLALELRASEKERAENLMIVDLIRSDLGRISAAGSVEVTDLFSVEQYPTVWQLTSSVRSRLQPGTTIEHIFAALFPSGSVTGAPKVSAMAAIAELERAPRGVYCGAIGYIEPGPKLRARFAVAIRTAVIDRVTGAATYGSGGAITWSSEAGNEWDELIQKTAVLEPDTALTGLIETMRSRPDASIHNLDFHLSRLLRSAEILGIPLDKAKLTTALGARRRAGRVRVHVGGAGELTVKVSDMPPADTGPVRLGVMNGSVSSDDATLFHKLADRSRYDRWRAQRPDLDDVILVNERGEVTETTIANLAVHRDGRWWTPQLDAGLLPGVERRRLLEAGLLAERVIRVADLTGARLAVISSLRGWRPAILIDG